VTYVKFVKEKPVIKTRTRKDREDDHRRYEASLPTKWRTEKIIESIQKEKKEKQAEIDKKIQEEAEKKRREKEAQNAAAAAVAKEAQAKAQ
jgi:hypothetical protein